MRKLVEISPFRSIDDTLYLGYKKTEIIRIVASTGKVIESYTKNWKSMGSVVYEETLYIAKTEYNILIFEQGISETPRYIHKSNHLPFIFIS